MAKRGPKPKRQEIVWSSDFAYAVGLIATDGNLSPDGRHLEVTSKDIQQIENVRTCLSIIPKTSRKSGGIKSGGREYFRIQWSDSYLYSFLVSIGITKRKSLTLGSIEIPDEFFFDFLRGSFDGDGCFYSYFDRRWESSFMFYLSFLSASREHIFWLQRSINRFLGLNGHVTETGKTCKMWTLKYAKSETLILLEHMYPRTDVRCLERKRLKIVIALRIVGITLPTMPELAN